MALFFCLLCLGNGRNHPYSFATGDSTMAQIGIPVSRVEDVRPHVVVVGAGFGGLWTAKALANAPVRVTVFDKNNYHTFLPLLYQVAAAELAPEQIGYPVRAILRDYENVEFALAEVTAVHLEDNRIDVSGHTIEYDYLVLASGSVSNFFGIKGAVEHAFSLKTLSEGIALRNHILHCFELAMYEPDEAARRALLTFVVAGGGPTGVEYAGALSELIYGPLAGDYPSLNMDEVKIVVVEAAADLLSAMPVHLRSYARTRLEKMRVEVLLDTLVTAVSENEVAFKDGASIETKTVVWTAGVGGDALARSLDLDLTGNGRLVVEPTLQLPSFPDVFVIGDLAGFATEDGYLPMLAPVATQQGTAVGENIKRALAGDALFAFSYKDRGSMATIGRNKAVAMIGGRAFAGIMAWLVWLVIHLRNLIGFRNRLTVLINWAWSYLFFDRVVRLILPSPDDKNTAVTSDKQINL